MGGSVFQDCNGIFETIGIYGKLEAVIDLYSGEMSSLILFLKIIFVRLLIS